MGTALMDNKLRKLQLTQIEILNAVDCFCRENGSPFFFCAGTLLGSVWHHRFIPWDNSIDIEITINGVTKHER